MSADNEERSCSNYGDRYGSDCELSAGDDDLLTWEVSADVGELLSDSSSASDEGSGFGDMRSGAQCLRLQINYK